jgi:uncharacterized protein (TIGR04255 family)
MTADSAPLPEYERPPVSEVALSIEFSPLQNWRSPHAGIYWAQVQKEYPNTEVQAPLPSQIEKFGESQWQRPRPRVEMLNPDMNRFWFLSEPPNRLVQVQRDRFVVNWRKVKGDEVYPRYFKEMRPRFEREWEGYKRFVAEQKLGVVSTRQCEVIYVNDILKGVEWETYEESLNLFSPWWKNGSDGFLPCPENLALNGAFLFPKEAGRLHFTVQSALRGIDEKETIRFQLIARGKPASDKDADIMQWMDLGHEWIVRGFTDLTSTHAHELWGRKR